MIITLTTPKQIWEKKKKHTTPKCAPHKMQMLIVHEHSSLCAPVFTSPHVTSQSYESHSVATSAVNSHKFTSTDSFIYIAAESPPHVHFIYFNKVVSATVSYRINECNNWSAF